MPRLLPTIFGSVMHFVAFLVFLTGFICAALPSPAISNDLQPVLAEISKSIERPSRRTIDKAIEKLFSSGANGVPRFLKRWREKRVWFNKQSRKFFFGPDKRGDIELLISTPAVLSGISRHGP